MKYGLIFKFVFILHTPLFLSHNFSYDKTNLFDSWHALCKLCFDDREHVEENGRSGICGCELWNGEGEDSI